MKNQIHISDNGVSVSVDHLYPVLPVLDEVQQSVSMCVTLTPQMSIVQNEVPIDVLCIIDVSSSMLQSCGVGDTTSRLSACVEALQSVVQQLSSCDRFSYVAFSDAIKAQLPLVPLNSAQNVEMIEQDLLQLRADGSTRFSPALMLAQEILMSSCEQGEGLRSRQIVVFITDGESQYELEDKPAMREFAEFLRSRSIAFIAIGTGVEYRSELLHDMAARVGGNSSALHAQGMSEIKGYLLGEVCYAKGAQISEVSFSVSSVRKGVFLSGATLLSHGCKELLVHQRRSCEVNTGWLGHLRGQQFLLSFDVSNVPVGVHEIAEILLRYSMGQEMHQVTQKYFLSIECCVGVRELGRENPVVWKKQCMALGFKMLRENNLLQAQVLFGGVGSSTMSRMLSELSKLQDRHTKVIEHVQHEQMLRSVVTMTSNATCFGTLDALPKVDSRYDPNIVASEMMAYRENTRIFWKTSCSKCGERYPRGTLYCSKDNEMLFEHLPYPRLQNDIFAPILELVPIRNVDRMLTKKECDQLSLQLTGEDFQKHHGQLFIGRPDPDQGYVPTIDVSVIAGRLVSRQQALLRYNALERFFELQPLSSTVCMYRCKSNEKISRQLENHIWVELRDGDLFTIGYPYGSYSAFRVRFL